MRQTPYWWHHPQVIAFDGAPTPPSPLPADADVAVIGAGFAGLTAALTLARAGKHVVLIEKSRPGMGAATRNAGICSGSIHLSHAELTARGGAAYADAVHAEATAARADLRDFITAEKIDCAYNPAAGFFRGAMSPAHFDALARQAEALARLPGIHAEAIPPSRRAEYVNSTRFCGGLLLGHIAAFHPALFYTGLLQRAAEAGVEMRFETALQSIENHGDAKRVITTAGAMRTASVLITTNAYTGREGAFSRFLRRRLIPVQSAIIVTADLGEARVRECLPQLTSFGTSAHILAYARPTPDGRRLLIGSRSLDARFVLRRSLRFLTRQLTAIFPALADTAIDYAWLGNVAFTRPMLPALFSHDGVIYAGGYGGSGTVWARWLGKKAAEKMLGANTAPSIFAGDPPPAFPFYDGNPWFMRPVFGWYALRDFLNERGA